MSLAESNKAVLPIVRTIVGVVWVVLSAALLCRAQEAPVLAPPPVGDTKPGVEITEVKPPQPADLIPLAKVMKALNASVSLFYEGDVEIKGEGKGLRFTARERVRFLGKHPGRVRSDVMVSLGDAPSGKRYLIVSDGKQVWTQRPGTRQYSIGRFSAPEFTRNLNGLGILGALYFNQDLLSGIGMITPDNATEFVDQLKKENIDLSGMMETVDGVEMPVYTLTIAGQNTTFRFFVDPKQAVLRRLEVTALDKGMHFTMTESVVRLNPSPKLKGTEFKFVPPPGYARTERITVEML